MRTEIISLHGLTLRTWDAADIQGYASLVSDSETMQFISAGTTRTEQDAAAEVATFQEAHAKQGWSRWAVSLGLGSPFIGYAGFAEKEWGINFGMRFLKPYWGTPYPFTTAHMAVTYAFETLGFEKVYTLTNLKHTAALNMNKKLLNLEVLPDCIIETPFGPHVKIDVTKQKILEVRAKNAARIESLINYFEQKRERALEAPKQGAHHANV